MILTDLTPVRPDAADVQTADVAVRRVKHYLASHADDHDLALAVDGDSVIVPRGAVELLARVLAAMAAGHGVSVLPLHGELTTQQAAEVLNVSRPYLISLLDAGKIKYRKVGKHRRVDAESLLIYRRRDDQDRRAAADELTTLNREMGLY